MYGKILGVAKREAYDVLHNMDMVVKKVAYFHRDESFKGMLPGGNFKIGKTKSQRACEEDAGDF
jgi:hypothetical protein